MSTEQVDENQPLPVEVNDWNGLYQYAEVLCQGSNKNIKICMIDEEQDEIRIQNKDEFDLNIKYAQDHEIKSVKFVVYIDDKHAFNGVYNVAAPRNDFPLDKFQILLDNVLAEKWYIPVKQDEALGVCLLAAIKLAQDNKLETNVECKKFIDDIVPEAFRKIQNTQSVYSWPREIQCGIFELLELLIDLIGTRLRHPPVPITLLSTLAMSLDTKTTFSQKHKNELIPLRRTYTLKEGDFLQYEYDKDTFGWLRSIIQRFIAQNGLANIRLQFEYIDVSNSTLSALEFNALLKVFSNCAQCINTTSFQTIFARPVRQAIQYLQTQKSSNELTAELKILNDTLFDICYKYEFKNEINKLLALSSYQQIPSSIETCSEITPLIDISKPIQRKTKKQDCYERLAEDIQSMTMHFNDLERKNIKKQRTDEQPLTPLFTRNHLLDCIDELLTTTTVDTHTLKRKHRREQQRSTLTSISKKDTKRSTTNKTYDRTNPEDILRYFAPMKLKIATLYDNIQIATSNGNLREVLKLEEKLKLLHPFSARFIADENTPDGTTMKPGEIFRKNWILLNDGSMPWDNNDIHLINLSDGIEVVQQPIVPVTAPHDRAVISVDYKCSDQAGSYESKWILAYRQQTFGPMIWCSIEVSQSKEIENKIQPVINEDFEFIEVPLPACFDLTKPFQANENSFHSSFILSRSDSIESTSTYFNTLDLDRNANDGDELSNSLPSLQITNENPRTLSNLSSLTSSDEEHQTPRLNQSLDFVDSVVTNIFSVAKQAGSTAKAIFNTLQAYEQPISSNQDQQATLVNTFSTNQANSNSVFENIEEISSPKSSLNSNPSSDPMKTLIEMGFANRTKNQRLLKENANDLAKVIELLTLDVNEDVDWFIHRH